MTASRGVVCPDWCSGSHEMTLDPLFGVDHERLVEVLTVDAPPGLVTVSLGSLDDGDESEEPDPPAILTTGPDLNVLSAGEARAYAHALLRAADELDVVTSGGRA